MMSNIRGILKVMLIGVLLLVTITDLDTLYKQRDLKRILCNELLVRRSLSDAKDCLEYWPQGTGEPEFWEERFTPLDHSASASASRAIDSYRERPSSGVAYVVTFTSCEDYPGDPGPAFFDAASMLKHSVCENGDPPSSDNNPATPTTSYQYSMYAIVHPDVVTCTGPNGVVYDRVRLLQSLGYWVKIWDLPLAQEDLDPQPPPVEVDNELKDLIKLDALKLDTEYVVLLDFTYYGKEALDSVFEGLSLSTKKGAFVSDDETNGILTSPLIMKTDATLFDELLDLYRNTPYNPATGGGGSDIGNYPGGMGTGGFLSYYFKIKEPGSGEELNRCKCANNADQSCSNWPLDDISSITMTDSVCGQPWECDFPKDGWSTDTQNLCGEFFKYWADSRLDYQANHVMGKEPPEYNGSYVPEAYNGYCNGQGPANYFPMLNNEEPKLVICETETFVGCEPTDSTSSIVFVIDRSGSTCEVAPFGCSSDENFDLNFDDSLDCQIAAVLDMVVKLRAEGTVEKVGVVSFSHDMRSMDGVNVELELTDITVPNGNIFHSVEDSIRELQCGGATNYAGAVSAACSVIEQSTSLHNLVVFLSDGQPNRGGEVHAYCSNNAVFHTVAIGDSASCDAVEGAPYETSLQKIADDTGGTCTTVSALPELRTVMKSLSEVDINEISGSVINIGSHTGFGCSDIPGFSAFGMTCGLFFAETTCLTHGFFYNAAGITVLDACCVCGGGEFRSTGEFDQININGLHRAYNQVVRLPPGEHDICTSLEGMAVGKPQVLKNCKRVHICPHPDDGVPG